LQTSSASLCAKKQARNLRYFLSKRTKYDLLGLTYDYGEVFGALEALRVEFIDVLCPGGAGGKPAARRNDLQAAD
jgi:hypothetical protein